jgi:hypothetical protein
MRSFAARLFLCLCFSTPALALDEAQRAADYEELSRIPAKYEVIGTICEYMTSIRLREQYPEDQYFIEVGIEYKVGGRVIGEIDNVVFRKSDKEAVAVAQVKCRQGMSRAHHDASEQNERFADTMLARGGQTRAVTFRSTSKPDLVVLQENMDEVETYITASQDGGEEYGFDLTIGYTLDEAMAIRERLMRCQQAGQCPRPH